MAKSFTRLLRVLSRHSQPAFEVKLVRRETFQGVWSSITTVMRCISRLRNMECCGKWADIQKRSCCSTHDSVFISKQLTFLQHKKPHWFELTSERRLREKLLKIHESKKQMSDTGVRRCSLRKLPRVAEQANRFWVYKLNSLGVLGVFAEFWQKVRFHSFQIHGPFRLIIMIIFSNFISYHI